MKPAAPERTVFFEPWNLGDVIIAAAALRESKKPVSLACHSMWHPLLRCALNEIPNLDLIAVDLPYTTRQRGNPFDTGNPNERFEDVREVRSIRGDLRDFAAARKIFPHAHIRMKGWLRFFGRKSAIVNFPYAMGLYRVQNRYRSWAKLAGVEYEEIRATYRRLQAQSPNNGRVLIHVGAQWGSKQFPNVAELRDALAERSFAVTILAAPNDPLPLKIDEHDTFRIADDPLIHELRSAEHVITNDSGPMHLAAFLGCRTTAIVRTSPIEEWAPPATTIIHSSVTPRGYRPSQSYMSDEILAGWPTVSEIVPAILHAPSPDGPMI